MQNFQNSIKLCLAHTEKEIYELNTSVYFLNKTVSGLVTLKFHLHPYFGIINKIQYKVLAHSNRI